MMQVLISSLWRKSDEFNLEKKPSSEDLLEINVDASWKPSSEDLLEINSDASKVSHLVNWTLGYTSSTHNHTDMLWEKVNKGSGQQETHKTSTLHKEMEKNDVAKFGLDPCWS